MSGFKMKAENNELIEFADKIKALKDNKEQIKYALLQAGQSYLKDVISATPINKDPNALTRGNLKKQWKKDNQNLEIKIKEVDSGFLLELVNTTYYASWVEKGHKAIPNQFVPPLKKRIKSTTTWVMGQFFVRKTEVKFQNGKLDRVVARAIQKWLKEYFE